MTTRTTTANTATGAAPGWTFLSNHAHVLLLIARDPAIKLRDAALQVGITERAVQRIVADLEAADYIARERVGRRNHYRIHTRAHLRHPIEAHVQIGALLDLILATAPAPARLEASAPAGKRAGRPAKA